MRDRVGHLGKPAHWLKELCEVGEKYSQRAQRHRARHEQQRTPPQHQSGTHCDHQADHRRRQHGYLVRPQPRRHIGRVGLPDPVLLAFLGGKGLDHHHRLEAFLKGGYQLGLVDSQLVHRDPDGLADVQDKDG
jgi:hypothetical protein